MTDSEVTMAPGTVARYQPEDRWCREGMAIANDEGVLFDTYWNHDRDRLSAAEQATAAALFNTSDFRQLSEGEALSWSDYHPADRARITSQHGLLSQWFVRLGAEPDLGTKIENAREAVSEAEGHLRGAEHAVQWRREYLAELEARLTTAVAHPPDAGTGREGS